MKTILVNKLFSQDLALRDSANHLFKKISKFREVTVDFCGVRSMTRSFAHQYVTNKSATSTRLKEVNVSAGLKQMFELAERPVAVANHASQKKVKVMSLTL